MTSSREDDFNRDGDRERQIAALSQYGLTDEDIASIVGIDVDAMRRDYAAELHRGRALARVTIGRALFNRAKEGDSRAASQWIRRSSALSAKGAPGLLDRPMTLEDVTLRFQTHGPLAMGALVCALEDPEASHRDRIAAAREILDRAYGKAKQAVEHSGQGGGPLRFTFDGISIDDLAKIAKGGK